MNISPLEITKKEFKRSFRGYNEEEVRDFLEKVAQSYERIYKENLEFKEREKALEEKLNEYREMEATLKSALVLAEKTAQDVRKNAQKEGELIIKEALAKASRIIKRAEEKYNDMHNRYTEMRQQFVLFKTRFLNFLQSQIEFIKSCELDPEQDFDAFESFREAAAGKEWKKDSSCECLHIPGDGIESDGETSKDDAFDSNMKPEKNEIDETAEDEGKQEQ
jgi:cell division initiation protein